MLKDDFSSFKEIVQPGRPRQPALLLWHTAGPSCVPTLQYGIQSELPS